MSFQLSIRTFNNFATQVGGVSRRTQGHRARPFSQTFRQMASQGYGDGQGDPKGEKPQEQGPSTGAQHKAEHPGPVSPTERSNTGSATKVTSDSSSGTKSPGEASASSGGSRSKEAKETGSSPTGGEVGSGESTSQQRSGPRPKISDMSKPNADNSERQAEVEQHNKEFEQRYDRAPEAEDDKVDKKFWRG